MPQEVQHNNLTVSLFVRAMSIGVMLLSQFILNRKLFKCATS